MAALMYKINLNRRAENPIRVQTAYP